MSEALRQQIYKYAKLPQTGVSLRQMVQFGPRPSQGSLFHASYFAVHELPIRLSHRVRELEHLPLGLSEEPSIKLVRDWYAQSFEELMAVEEPKLSEEFEELLMKNMKSDKIWEVDPSKETTGTQSDKFFFEDDGVVIGRRERRPMETDEFFDPQVEAVNKYEELDIDDFDKPIGLKSYYQSYPSDITYPQEVKDYLTQVTRVLTKIKRRHDATVSTLARGVQRWKQKNNYKYLNSPINQFLDRFYMSRIGIRMLIGQTIAINLQSQKNMQNDDYVGIICLKCNIKEIIEDAVDAARFACEEHYNMMDVPKVRLYCPNDLTFRYVPGHLVHMLFETLKNSLGATIEHHSKLNPGVDLDDINYPQIKIIVAKGDEDITIKVSDEGGGIPRSVVPLVWTYFYTSAAKPVGEDDLLDGHNHKVPFTGLGVGLPHSRLYARYFSGDLKLISMEGYGTDVYLHLNRLSGSTEPLQ